MHRRHRNRRLQCTRRRSPSLRCRTGRLGRGGHSTHNQAAGRNSQCRYRTHHHPGNCCHWESRYNRRRRTHHPCKPHCRRNPSVSACSYRHRTCRWCMDRCRRNPEACVCRPRHRKHRSCRHRRRHNRHRRRRVDSLQVCQSTDSQRRCSRPRSTERAG